jgi:hypothetical protein
MNPYPKDIRAYTYDSRGIWFFRLNNGQLAQWVQPGLHVGVDAGGTGFSTRRGAYQFFGVRYGLPIELPQLRAA